MNQSKRCFKIINYFNKTTNNVIFCSYHDEAKLYRFYQEAKFFSKKSQNIHFFPTYNYYANATESEKKLVLYKRSKLLTEILNQKESKLIITNICNLLHKLPVPSYYIANKLTIKCGSKAITSSISQFLINIGYNRVSNAFNLGEFSVYGEILDIILSDNEGYRIYFAWNHIESIKKIDLNTNFAKEDVNNITIYPICNISLTDESIHKFKENFRMELQDKKLENTLYKNITNRTYSISCENLLPLFYDQMTDLISFIDDAQSKKTELIFDDLCMKSMEDYITNFTMHYDFFISKTKGNRDVTKNSEIDNDFNILGPTNDEIMLAPSLLFHKLDYIRNKIKNHNNLSTLFDLHNQEDINLLQIKIKRSKIDQLFEIINSNRSKLVIIFTNSDISSRKIEMLANQRSCFVKRINSINEAERNCINLVSISLENSFTCHDIICISEYDIFGYKIGNNDNRKIIKSDKTKLKHLLSELHSITPGEIIVHKNYGIGKFINLELLEVKGKSHDFLKILYANNDILYLPVENIDLIKKYGSNTDKLDNLGNNSWVKRKEKIKKQINDIAGDLINVAAKRAISNTKEVFFDKENYKNFCDNFLYSETDDQLKAIDDIEIELTSGKLMDRLICGDVGFGKTEIAMRVAFMVASDLNKKNPQIAVISPTAILCKQHYEIFSKRFAGFDINIEQISRLVNSGEVKRIKNELESGKINIIIGTHALLAKDIKFNNLSLIIIDEEQHFGVKQKEQLKLLKADIHVLSMSATPIPRTMHSSIVGIKDLTLITTPPINRLPIRTKIIDFDIHEIKKILLFEKLRAGKSFYVCPRISDIDGIKEKLDLYIPELSYAVLHGQMTSTLIDKIIYDFYNGRYDILLATTIIGSGIDIPNVNTIIIHKPQLLGLSQLYQLRGRIGRGNVQGYAYLTLTKEIISDDAKQRLEILKNINSLGAGFALASYDMDLRGFGNLVGEKQAGHIKEIGFELYQDMLMEAISNLQENNQQIDKLVDFSPIIKLNIPVSIPESYINDSKVRLSIYRKVAVMETRQEIIDFTDEMINRFGKMPEEFQNLLETVLLRNKCIILKISQLTCNDNNCIITFHKDYYNIAVIVSFMDENKRFAKINSNHQLVINQDNLEKLHSIAMSNKILDQLLVYHTHFENSHFKMKRE